MEADHEGPEIPSLLTPPGHPAQAFVASDGRYPGSRLTRFLAFPSRLAQWRNEDTHRLQLRGQHRNWGFSPHRFPYSPEFFRAPSYKT